MNDAHGQPLGVGRARRTVPAWLVRLVRRRDGGCRLPNCDRRRWGHHRVHWADGGPTGSDNLLWLCPTRHRLVHEAGWRIDGELSGKLTFVSLEGRRFAAAPLGTYGSLPARSGSCAAIKSATTVARSEPV